MFLYLESWYGTVRYGTVRYGTVRHGTVRYGTVPSIFGNIAAKFGNGHGGLKLCSPSGQPYTWGHLGGVCGGLTGPHSATLWQEMHFFSACVAPSIFGNKAAKFGGGHGGCKVWGPGHLGGHGHTWGHLGGGHKMPMAHTVWHKQSICHFLPWPNCHFLPKKMKKKRFWPAQGPVGVGDGLWAPLPPTWHAPCHGGLQKMGVFC